MTEEFTVILPEKDDFGAVGIGAFAMYAAETFPSASMFWVSIAIIAVYFVSSRRIKRKVEFSAILSIFPISLFAAIVCVLSSFVFGNIIGHPLEMEPKSVVSIIVNLFIICWFGVCIWFVIGININESRISQSNFISKYIYSKYHAFLVGDIACALILGALLGSIKMGF